MKVKLFVAAAAILLMLIPTSTVVAAPLKLSGFLGYEGPIGFQPDHRTNRSPQVLGNLTLKELPLHSWFTLDVQHSTEGIGDPESKVKGTFWLPVNKQKTLVAYTYFERRYMISPREDRAVAGVRYYFSAH